MWISQLPELRNVDFATGPGPAPARPPAQENAPPPGPGRSNPRWGGHPPAIAPMDLIEANSWLLSFWGRAQTGYNRPEMAPKWSDLGPPTSGQVHWG